jgi:transcriptional regulator with XRE-family HTH domain
LKGFTQTELSEAVGVSIAIIGAVERNARKADPMLLKRICEVLGVEQQELIISTPSEEM